MTICPVCGYSALIHGCGVVRPCFLAATRGRHMASLHVVTNGACKGLRNGCGCPSCTSGLARIVSWRIHCDACGNDPERCLEGQGEAGDFEKLAGCRAFTDEGAIRPKRAKKAPAQPWQPKPSRKAA